MSQRATAPRRSRTRCGSMENPSPPAASWSHIRSCSVPTSATSDGNSPRSSRNRPHSTLIAGAVSPSNRLVAWSRHARSSSGSRRVGNCPRPSEGIRDDRSHSTASHTRAMAASHRVRGHGHNARGTISRRRSKRPSRSHGARDSSPSYWPRSPSTNTTDDESGNRSPNGLPGPALPAS